MQEKIYSLFSSQKTLKTCLAIFYVMFLTYFIFFFCRPINDLPYIYFFEEIFFFIVITLSVIFFYTRRSYKVIKVLNTLLMIVNIATLVASAFIYSFSYATDTLSLIIHIVLCVFSFGILICNLGVNTEFNSRTNYKFINALHNNCIGLFISSFIMVILIISLLIKNHFNYYYFSMMLSYITVTFSLICCSIFNTLISNSHLISHKKISKKK